MMESRVAKMGGFLLISFWSLSVAAAKPPVDPLITGWVNEALYEDPRIASSTIAVNTIEGIVTLTGNVNNLVQKQYAELEAKKIRGVLGVINKLIVKPMIRPDIEIRHDIRRRIINSSDISSESIGVKVENGAVVLTGVVPSYSEKQEADLLAGEVRGVMSIDNNIMMSFGPKRPDTEINADIRTKIGRDVYLAELPITVRVEKGVASLSGQVDNAYEKDRATEDALGIANVSSVTNNLKVRWWEMTEVRVKAPLPSDSALAKWVGEELYVDFRITKPWNVLVKCKGGHVDLWGTLPTLRQKLLAQQDAANVVGVAWVSDRIIVKCPWREDLDISADARFALGSDYEIANDNITLAVNNGSVTLKGDVTTSYERSQAEKDVSGVLGVVDVINDIVIYWGPRFFDKPLGERIANRLTGNWKTSPVAEKITVSVQNGAVTLTGDVDNWAQYNEAVRVVFLTQGVRRVDNRLKVHGVNYLWENYRTATPDVLSQSDNGDLWRMFNYYH
jgi:osmotically-inducible protein OsmY